MPIRARTQTYAEVTDPSLRGTMPAAKGALGKARRAQMEHKWTQLRKRGITPPKDAAENRQKAWEAHHGRQRN